MVLVRPPSASKRPSDALIIKNCPIPVRKRMTAMRYIAQTMPEKTAVAMLKARALP